MFKIHNGRLYADVTPRRLSFAIPEGFWLETLPQGNSEDHIAFLTADRKVEVEISVGSHTYESTADDVFRFFDDAPEAAVEGPSPIEVNGLSGHSIYFLEATNAQYVVLLDIGGGSFLGWDEGNEENEEDDWVDRIEVTVTVFGCKTDEEAAAKIRAVAKDLAIVALIESIDVHSEKAE